MPEEMEKRKNYKCTLCAVKRQKYTYYIIIHLLIYNQCSLPELFHQFIAR